MTTRTTGVEFKRFYLDSKYWPENSGIFYDDVLIVVDGHALPSEKDPRDIADNALVDIQCGWVEDIPAGVADGVTGMTLSDYFLHWEKLQTTATLVVECPREHLARVVLAVKAAGGSVQQGVEQMADQEKVSR